MTRPKRTWWFRVHVNILGNSKFQTLSESLRARLLNLWCIAAENDGVLPDVTGIAWTLRLTEKETAETIEKLKAAGFLEQGETGLTVHDWNEHQYTADVSTDRVKRHRNKKKQECNGDETVSETNVTPLRAEQSIVEQISRETTPTGPQLAPPLAGPDREKPLPPALFSAFERCRELHPNCTDPDAALREFLRLFWKGEITEADAPLMEPGMRRWLDSEVWAEGQGRYSAEWRKFSAWIGGKAWLANPAPSAAAKHAGSSGKRSSDGVDANAEWVAPWKKTAGGVA